MVYIGVYWYARFSDAPIQRDLVLWTEDISFSRMLRQGFPFHSGGVGVELCSPDVAQPFATIRNRSQPSAAVRNRSQPFARGRYGRAYGKFCKMGHFWTFSASRSFVSFGRRGTLWHFNIFHGVSKVVLSGTRNTFCDVFRRCVAFRDRSSALETSDVILRGRRTTFNVSRCVFFANRIVSAARSGDKVQEWHFVTYDENRWTPRAKSRFWGRFVRKLVEKRWFRSCEVWNVRKSRTKCWFWCSNMSRLGSLVLVVPSQCLWGKLQNLSSLNVSKQAVMSFCVAGVALRDIPTCFTTCQTSFCVADAILLRRFRRCIAFIVAGAALWRPPTSFCVAGAALETCPVACFLRIALSGLRQVVTLNTPTLYAPLDTLHPHFTRQTWRFTPHTLHSTLYTHTLHSHFTVHTLHCPLYTPHFRLSTPHLILHTLHFTLHTSHFLLHIVHFTLHTLHSLSLLS